MSKIRCNCCKAEIAVPYRPAEKRYDEVTSYRREGNFQMGRAICEEILREYSKDAEAYFGRLLCRYGIQYKRNPASMEWEPQCAFPMQEVITEDSDYIRAVELSGPVKRKTYQKIAEDIDRKCRKRILFCYRPNEHQLEWLERELLGFKEADVNGNADKKADANEKTDAGRKADVDRMAGADKKADVNKTTDTDERKEAKKETDAEEKTLFSETDKVKLAVLEKRKEKIQKAIQKLQSDWLAWEQRNRNIYRIIAVFLFAFAVIIFTVLLTAGEFSAGIFGAGTYIIAFSGCFGFLSTSAGEKYLYENNIKKQEKGLEKIEEEIRQIKKKSGN